MLSINCSPLPNPLPEGEGITMLLLPLPEGEGITMLLLPPPEGEGITTLLRPLPLGEGWGEGCNSLLLQSINSNNFFQYIQPYSYRIHILCIYYLFHLLTGCL